MLSVNALYTEYPNDTGQVVKAAQNVTFNVPEGKLFTLLGPSGCGKTTVLRSIAGLEKPKSGVISVDGRIVYSSQANIFVAPNKRGFGMVFQSYAIWPHMNVFQNAAFPLQVGQNKRSTREAKEKVMSVLTAVGLDHLADREATKLSGGQQQRLAFARALVLEPKLLLLDEPLSNLDAKLREQMRIEIKRLQREFNLTMVYVTHDQSEALALSHEIAVMQAGRIMQIGSPYDIYGRPGSKFVADFVGLTNFLDGTVNDAAGDGAYRVATALGQLRVATLDQLTPGDSIVISVRPEDVELSEQRQDGVNVFQALLDEKVFLGECLDLQIMVGDHRLFARVHPALKTGVGGTVYVRMNPEKCYSIKADVPELGAA